MKLSRRALLTTIAALRLVRPATASEVNAADALVQLLSDQDAAASLGAAWLQQNQMQPEAVLVSLQGRLRDQGWASDGDRDVLRSAMGAAIADDFRIGDTVTIEGWQVARTQVELCALAYFKQTDRL